MKVRCINNNGIINGMLSIGEIYEVLVEDSIGYKLSDDLGRDIYFFKERFEIVEEDKEMKFKVGDKVRVREDLEIDKMYGNYEFIKEMAHLKGEIVTIKEVLKSGYRIEEEYYMWTDEMLEEVKLELKEKTFREVIADIKEREVWICEKFNRKIIKGDDGVIEIRKLNDGTFDNISGLIFNDEKYKLQRQQYTFEEAFKAYEEGKEIESCEECRFKLIDKDTILIIDCVGDEMEYSNAKDLFSVKEIRGKWYINN